MTKGGILLQSSCLSKLKYYFSSLILGRTSSVSHNSSDICPLYALGGFCKSRAMFT